MHAVGVPVERDPYRPARSLRILSITPACPGLDRRWRHWQTLLRPSWRRTAGGRRRYGGATINRRPVRTIESTGRDRLTRPAYSVAEAGRLARLTSGRVRRWLRGYEYSYGDAVRGQPPVLQGSGTESSYASFLDLVDLLFVKRFLDHGVSLQKVRRALDEARRLLGTDHFARQTFFTDGGSIFLELQEGARRGRGEAILELMSGGQWVIAPVIRELARQIEFESPEGLASRWYPLGQNRPVVLDPTVSFGAPSIAGRGVKTINIHDLFVAENENLASVRAWWDLTDDEIQAAVDFERQLAA